MNFWNQLPLFRILIPFLAGIIFSLLFPVFFGMASPYVLFPVIIFIVLAILYPRIFKNFSTRWIFGIILNIIIFFVACNLTVPRLINDSPSDLRNIKHSSDTVIATIDDPVVERENSYKVILEINAVRKNGSWQKAEGKVMTYLQKDSMAANLSYGDRMVLASSFTEIKSSQNPAEFDYKKYLSMRSIFLQSYVKSGKWMLLERNKGNYLREMALNIRDKFLKIFREYDIQGEEYAVAGALILGYTDKLDQDLINVYSGSGALHILSVSGMHVGIIFIVLNFLLAFLDRKKKGRYIKLVTLILLIWFYAAITGLSPAVNRAAAMITFVIAGRIFGRNTNIYNTLAASAMLLLVFNPLLVSDVGFQLSYIAVFGIVLLQKKIHNLWQPSNWLLLQIWLIVSVSIAAQIATFPLSIFYFHQFPNYFLFTNLVVVPFSSFIIYCGMIVLIASTFAFIASLFSKAFVYMLYGLNYTIRFIENLPYSVTHGLTLSSMETIMLYVLIAFVIAFLFNRKTIMLKLAAVMSIVFFISLAVGKYEALSQKKIVVYNVKKSTAIDFIYGKDHFLFTDSLLLANEKSIKTHINNHWIKLRLNDATNIDEQSLSDSSYEFESKSFFIKQNIIQFFDKRLAFVNENNFRNVSDKTLQLDYLVISGNIRADIDELLDSYHPKLIIIDSSNSNWRTEKWVKECDALNMPCYSVLKSGAYIEEI
ncbi:MAG: ComEC/Rec2 family competence protein [Bacteroidota bacterium]